MAHRNCPTGLDLKSCQPALFDGTQSLQSLQKPCSKQPDLHHAHKTSEEQAAALDPIPPCCQRRTEALSAHPSGSRALLISGTAYLCPFHSRHGAGGNSSPCPLFFRASRSQMETWLSAKEGRSPRKAR